MSSKVEPILKGAMDGMDFHCNHYYRKCKYISPCCDKVYMCRLCHDEKEKHEMKRKDVKEVECIKCQTRQKFQQTCESCSIVFGKYCCQVCHLLDDEVSKKQFHCDKCGLCRIGGADNFYHCDTCDLCLSKSLKDNHKCIEKASHDVCPICRDFLHTSRLNMHVPPCGHLLHTECFEGMLQTGNYACPRCNVSMVDMETVWQKVDDEITHTQMPDEYKDMKVDVLCRDCHKESQVLFHVLGLKCSHCGSYNTARN